MRLIKNSFCALFFSFAALFSCNAQLTLWGVEIGGFDTSTANPKLFMLKSNPYFSHVRIQYSLHCAGVFVFGGNRMKEETPQRLDAVNHAKELSDIISEKLGEGITVGREMNGNCSGKVDNFYLWKKQIQPDKWVTAFMLPGNKGFIFQTHLHLSDQNANEYIFYELLPRAGGISNCIDSETKAKFHIQ